MYLVKKIASSKHLILFVSLFFSCPVIATEAPLHSADILYVLSNDTGFYQNFTDKLQKYTNTSKENLRHRSSHRISSTDPALKNEIDAHHKLIVSVGSNALKKIYESGYIGPHLSVLTPATTVKKYKHSANFSALYIDHPVHRYLKLIKAAMPTSNRVGILLGPSSSQYEDELQNVAKDIGLQLYVKKINLSKYVSRKAGQLAADVDVMLALPDPVIHNSQTAQSILYASYRHNVPIIAYSSSYLKAGAMISLYSSPDQIAKNAASHIISRLDASPDLVVESSYPSIFSIGINRSVSRSFSYESLNETELMDAINPDKVRNNE